MTSNGPAKSPEEGNGRGSKPTSAEDGRPFRRYDRSLLCTVEEAAETLSIGRTSIYELLRDGRLRSVKVGARRLIPIAALEDFVNDLLEAS